MPTWQTAVNGNFSEMAHASTGIHYGREKMGKKGVLAKK